MYMLAFLVAYPSIHIFHSCISHPFYRLETSPILQSHVIPVFIRRIETPPYHIFFRMAMLFGVVSQRFRATNQPYHKPPSPFPSCIPSTLVAPSRDRFYFLNSLTLFSKIQAHVCTYIFSRFIYPLLFLEWYT